MNFYALLLLVHSWNRWLAVLALVATTALAWRGWLADKPYTKRDTMLRGATVGLNHLQVIFGFVLYFQSPLVEYLRSDMRGGLQIPEVAFFGVMHIAVMLIAALVLTIGGAIARRGATDAKKFRTVAIFFTVAIVLILLAMPSPISPFAQRPWMRLDF
jgi:ABC-type Na+ efflux pump permease subunit